MKSKIADKELSKYKTSEKDFDCVKMMRDIRTELFKKYNSNPQLMKKDLAEIKKKYTGR